MKFESDAGAAAAKNILVQFFRYLDERRYSQLADLMTDDGSWERQGRNLTSKNEIIEALEKRSHTLHIHHLLTNLFSEIVNDGITVTCYMLVVRHDSGKQITGSAPLNGVANIRTTRARLRHTPDGWRIYHLASDAPSFSAVDQ
ncbi:hypothetical protein CAP48_09180 [Advenella sp. S44]|uniref:nuclear transport factor 2 family protein n=1 Tax=Advenella sp. S44 TaxID=1982755 RepID=UPI000C2A7F6A|nr:nuclear transport factor 2 family protein [Advenella sp. S44]PJX26169.1 hypothetical protein CAP48_09180 [Advenella sp. S44]